MAIAIFSFFKNISNLCRLFDNVFFGTKMTKNTKEEDFVLTWNYLCMPAQASFVVIHKLFHYVTTVTSSFFKNIFVIDKIINP